MKNLTVLVVLMWASFQVIAQTDTSDAAYDKLMTAAYVKVEKATKVPELKACIKELEGVQKTFPKKWHTPYYVAYCYMWIGLTYGGDKDKKKIEELKNLGLDTDDPRFFLDLVDTFVHTTEGALVDLNNYLNKQDSAMVSKTAHAMKSSCGHFGARRMYELCYELEKNVPQEPKLFAEKLVEQINEEFVKVKTALKVEVDLSG